MPHPGVELMKPAAIAYHFAAVSHCCLATTKAVGQARRPSPVSTQDALHQFPRHQCTGWEGQSCWQCRRTWALFGAA